MTIVVWPAWYRMSSEGPVWYKKWHEEIVDDRRPRVRVQG